MSISIIHVYVQISINNTLPPRLYVYPIIQKYNNAYMYVPLHHNRQNYYKVIEVGKVRH